MLTISYYDYLKRMHKCINCWDKRTKLPRDKSGQVKAGTYIERLCPECQSKADPKEDMKVRKQSRNFIYFEGDVVCIEHDKVKIVKEGKKEKKEIVRGKTHRRIMNFTLGGKMGMVPVSSPIKHRRDFECEYEGWNYAKDIIGADGHLKQSGMTSLGWWPLDYTGNKEDACPICGELLTNGKCENNSCGGFAYIPDKEDEN